MSIWRESTHWSWSWRWRRDRLTWKLEQNLLIESTSFRFLQSKHNMNVVAAVVAEFVIHAWWWAGEPAASDSTWCTELSPHWALHKEKSKRDITTKKRCLCEDPASYREQQLVCKPHNSINTIEAYQPANIYQLRQLTLAVQIKKVWCHQSVWYDGLD